MAYLIIHSRSMRRLVAVLAMLLMTVSAPLAAQAPSRAGGWSSQAARALIGYAGEIEREGLDPAAFPVPALAGALAAGDSARIDEAASRLFVALALALGEGVVPPEGREDWHITGPALSDAQLAALAGVARASGDPAAVLRGLAPDNDQYRALRAALAAQPDRASAASVALRVNIERWRWMPRDLGIRHLIANVPEYQVRLVDNGRVAAIHPIIVGKQSTPTPQLTASVTGAILNPDWVVPQSIIAESVGRLMRTRPAEARRRGYVATSLPGGGMRVVQAPGPGNALGQVKLAMANPWSIYLHDTPAKALFAQEKRAFSHGCLRTQDIMDLIALLLADRPEWSAARIAQAVVEGKTVLAPLSRPIPIHIVYFTMVADEQGGVRAVEDLYGRDAAIARLLVAGR